MYKLNGREVEIVETQIDDGMVQILEAYYVDDETTLTELELFKLETHYGCDLVQDYAEAAGDAMYESIRENQWG